MPEKRPQYWRKKEETHFEPAEVDEAIRHTEEVLDEAENRKKELIALSRGDVLKDLDDRNLRLKEGLQRVQGEENERLFEEKLQTSETIKELSSEIAETLETDLGDLSEEDWNALIDRLERLRTVALSNMEVFRKYQGNIGSQSSIGFAETLPSDFVIEQRVRGSLPWAARKLKPEWEKEGRDRFSTDLIAPDNAGDFSGYEVPWEIVPSDLTAEAEQRKKSAQEVAMEWMDLPEDVKAREMKVNIGVPDRWKTLGADVSAAVKEDPDVAAKASEYLELAKQVRGRRDASQNDFGPLLRKIHEAADKASHRAVERNRVVRASLETWSETDEAKGLGGRIAAGKKSIEEAQAESDRLQESGLLSRMLNSSKRKKLEKETADLWRAQRRLKEELRLAELDFYERMRTEHGDRRTELADERGKRLRRLAPPNVRGY